jgi:anti-anti-sigma factor
MEKQRPKHTSVRVGDGFAVVKPEKRLVGDAETDEFREITKQLNDQNMRFIVVDLGQIDWVSTPGLGALVEAHQRFAKRGAHVLLTRVDKRINNLLIITKLAMVFETFPTEQAALEAGQKLPAPQAPATPPA